MTDPDANPTKPVPHARPCGVCRRVLCVCPKDVPCRQYVDPEQHVPAETIAEFTAEYARKMGVTK